MNKAQRQVGKLCCKSRIALWQGSLTYNDYLERPNRLAIKLEKLIPQILVTLKSGNQNCYFAVPILRIEARLTNVMSLVRIRQCTIFLSSEPEVSTFQPEQGIAVKQPSAY